MIHLAASILSFMFLTAIAILALCVVVNVLVGIFETKPKPNRYVFKDEPFNNWTHGE